MHYVFAVRTYSLLCSAVSRVAADVGGERAQIKRVITQVCSDLFYLVRSEEIVVSSE